MPSARDKQERRRITRLLATFAHELRNPLQTIAAAIQLVELGHQNPGTVATMKAQMEHIVRLLDDIQDVAGLEHDKLTLRPEVLEVHDVLGRIVDANRDRLAREGRELRTTRYAVTAFVRADGDRLQQILSNLIVNACKYSPRGAPVDLSVELDGDEVCFAVRDHGVGMKPEEVERAFDMFEQLGAGRQGLGIGLTLVKRLTERQGGRVTVRGGPEGRGCTFVVMFPRWQG